jgi:hypothetical protein
VVKGKKEQSKDTDKRSRRPSRGTSQTIRTGDKKTFLSDVESSLVNYLKNLGTLPSPSQKKEDPLSRMLKLYAKKWREVKK